MTSSQTLRNWYPELVVGGVDSRWNVIGTRPKCDYRSCVKVPFLAAQSLGGVYELKVHPVTVEAFTALASVFRVWSYLFRDLAGGTVSCRKITGGTRTSLHAHGIALDINPSTNRYTSTALGGLIQWGKQTDMPKEMVKAAEAIRTKNGVRVFQWGGRWWTVKDPMHWQIQCSPNDLRHGIDWETVPYERDGDDMMTLTKPYTRGKDVSFWQKELKEHVDSSLKVDGVFGPVTAGVVVEARKRLGLDEVNVIDMTFARAFTKAYAGGPFALEGHTHIFEFRGETS